MRAAKIYFIWRMSIVVNGHIWKISFWIIRSLSLYLSLLINQLYNTKPFFDYCENVTIYLQHSASGIRSACQGSVGEGGVLLLTEDESTLNACGTFLRCFVMLQTLFTYFSLGNAANVSGIRTQIVRLGGFWADHSTTNTAYDWFIVWYVYNVWSILPMVYCVIGLQCFYLVCYWSTLPMVYCVIGLPNVSLI